MPVTVGVFVTPGNAAGRYNRSFESGFRLEKCAPRTYR